MINSTAYYNDFWNEMRGKQAVTDNLYNNVKARQMRTICPENQIKNIRQYYRKKVQSVSWQPL